MENVLIGLVIGVLLGGIIGWLFAGRKRSTPDDSSAALLLECRNQLEITEAELKAERLAGSDRGRELASVQTALAMTRESEANQRTESQGALSQAFDEIENKKREVNEVRGSLGETRVERDIANSKISLIEPENERLRIECQKFHEDVLEAERAKIRLEGEVKMLNEKLNNQQAELSNIRDSFQKEFKSVANELLVENANHFKAQSSEGLTKLLEPLRENIKDFKAKLEETSTEAGKQNAVLKEQISRISGDAANLVRALKGDVKVLGNWGEQRLDLILEKSGLQLGVHYERQLGATDISDDQRRYLDVVVKLPDNKSLVIDSKVSLVNYEAHINAEDEATRAFHLKKHIECIRKHVKDLGGKRYHDLYGISSPDFVLMYIPLEAAFFAAVVGEPELFADSLGKNVVLITNSTLLATLRTVSSVWRLAAQQENAAEIARRGGLLYDKFHGFIDDMEKLGGSLSKSQEHFEEAKKKLHQGRGNLVNQAQDLKELGAKASKSLPADLVESAKESERAIPHLH